MRRRSAWVRSRSRPGDRADLADHRQATAASPAAVVRRAGYSEGAVGLMRHLGSAMVPPWGRCLPRRRLWWSGRSCHYWSPSLTRLRSRRREEARRSRRLPPSSSGAWGKSRSHKDAATTARTCRGSRRGPRSAMSGGGRRGRARPAATPPPEPSSARSPSARPETVQQIIPTRRGCSSSPPGLQPSPALLASHQSATQGIRNRRGITVPALRVRRSL